MQRITTEAGAVAGRRSVRDPGVVELRGIPYAAPPFGAGRFRAPRPAASWDGVRDCTAFGPVAPQSAELPGSPGWSRGDEDILSLNIWTPGGGGDRLPVLVWIHGGAYVFGSSAQPDFDGTALCRHGLVVVTLNYRLGFEGFGHVPPTGGGETCPDNRGLLDQIAALRWVRDNIAAFGGDPDRVTVAGQSSGATSVACRAVMGPLLEAYRALMPDASVNDLYLAVYGDLLFGEYSSRLAESHARAGGRTHLSRFVRKRDGRGRPVRAWHCADIPFAFGTVEDESVHFLIGGPPAAADLALAERMTRAWADFATTGDPGWPPVTSGAVRIWDVAPEDDRGRWDAFRTPWRDAGLPLLAP
ncbi:carboxylesterase family protein [Streptomyces sp. P5-A9]|uniref:carboxylesterase family protein n=1 Tax=Streptomyces sp. P5-A9 TaxID=3071730 RepID=UPI002FC5F14D